MVMTMAMMTKMMMMVNKMMMVNMMMIVNMMTVVIMMMMMMVMMVMELLRRCQYFPSLHFLSLLRGNHGQVSASIALMFLRMRMMMVKRMWRIVMIVLPSDN